MKMIPDPGSMRLFFSRYSMQVAFHLVNTKQTDADLQNQVTPHGPARISGYVRRPHGECIFHYQIIRALRLGVLLE